MTDYLDEIQARADAATNGPWAAIERALGDVYIAELGMYGVAWDEPAEWHDSDEASLADADFIAHARTDVDRLVAFAKAVMALHVPEPVPTSQHFYCEPGECDRAGEGELLDRCEVCETVYPCETVRLADQHLGGDR